VDGTKLQGKVYYGYAQSAKRIGLPFSQYRPTSAVSPIGSGSLVGTILASFNAQDMKYSKPNSYGKPVWYCLADGRVMAVGDYFVGAPGTFFIASMQPLLPIQAIECNRTVTVFRPQQQAGVGAVGYGGNTAQNQTAIATGFPASVLINAKADNSSVKLPGDTRQAWWNLLLPPIPGNIIIQDADVVTDEIGNRYVVSAAELTDMGWRITMAESET
jgi:hypothetical protein